MSWSLDQGSPDDGDKIITCDDDDARSLESIHPVTDVSQGFYLPLDDDLNEHLRMLFREETTKFFKLDLLTLLNGVSVIEIFRTGVTSTSSASQLHSKATLHDFQAAPSSSNRRQMLACSSRSV